MLSEGLKADLTVLGDHYYKHPEIAVRRWSSIECEDYGIPLLIVTGLLIHAIPPLNRRRISLHDVPDHHAAADIVKASSLREVLRYDAGTHSIELVETVDAGTMREMAELLLAKRSYLYG